MCFLQRLVGIQTTARNAFSAQGADRIHAVEDDLFDLKGIHVRIIGLNQRRHAGHLWGGHGGAGLVVIRTAGNCAVNVASRGTEIHGSRAIIGGGG